MLKFNNGKKTESQMGWRVTYAWCLLVLSSGAIYGQYLVRETEFDQYTTRDGLSQNHVQAIIQDPLGFLWIGTEDGLNRFDGYTFNVYRHNKDNPNSLPGNAIRALLVDKSGVVWIGTNAGLCKYYPETEKFERIPVDYNDPSKGNGYQVNSIREREDGTVWVAYIGGGVDVFSPGKTEILHYTLHRDDGFRINNDIILDVLFLDDGHTLIGTQTSLLFAGSDGMILSEEEVLNRFPWKEKIDPSILCLFRGRDGNTVWVGTENLGAYRVNLKNHVVENFSTKSGHLTSNNVHAIYENEDGSVLIGTEKLNRLTSGKGASNTLSYRVNQNIINKAIRSPIYTIFEDKNKNIWFGTLRNGVYKYNLHQTPFKSYQTNTEGGRISNEILAFHQQDENTLVISAGKVGLLSMDKQNETFRGASLNNSLSSLTIKCITPSTDGGLWLGTWDGGLMKYHPEKSSLTIYHPDKGNFPARHVWDIKEDHKKNLWIGTLREGLVYFNTTDNTITHFKNIPGDSTSLVNNDVLSLLIDSQNKVWIGTSHGLSIYDPEKNQFTNLISGEGKNELSGNVIFCLYEDTEGKIWLGTNGEGITVLNKQRKIEKILRREDGLPGNTVCSIQPDDHHNLWITTYNGIAKIPHGDYRIFDMTHFSGLPSSEFIVRANYKTKDGRLLFGHANGFYTFHPDSLIPVQRMNKVMITSLKVLNQEVTPLSGKGDNSILSKSIAVSDRINLSYKNYSFTIGFSVLNFFHQRNLHYAYMLENLDTDWQYTTSERPYVHYATLAPGDYILKIKSSYDGINWGENPTSLNITIHPPWWETLWFRLSVAFIILAGLIIAHRLRTQMLIKQTVRLESVVAQRTSELQKSNDDLVEKTNRIEMQHEEIQTLMEEQVGQRNNIELKNEELEQINNELALQRDALHVKTHELIKAQQKMKEINAQLEELVASRTEKLNHTLGELETFLYRASHDLRGPITSMQGLIQLAAIDPDKNTTRQYIEFLNKPVTKLERTLLKLVQKYTIEKRLLDWSHVTREELINLLAIIASEISYFRQKDFEINISESFAFETDKALLTISLSNILENAFFFSHRASNEKVILNGWQDNGTTIFSIQDFGCGIKDTIKPRLFTMFYRGNERSEGNGLGLYLVKNALYKIDGTVDFETEEGRYSRFIIRLPNKKNQMA